MAKYVRVTKLCRDARGRRSREGTHVRTYRTFGARTHAARAHVSLQLIFFGEARALWMKGFALVSWLIAYVALRASSSAVVP